MAKPTEPEILQRERTRLRESLTSLSALRPPSKKGPSAQDTAEQDESTLLLEFPFVRQIGFSEMVWDDPEDSTPVVSSAPTMEQAEQFAANFGWDDAGLAGNPPTNPITDPLVEPVDKPMTTETTDAVFTQFDWE